MLSALASVDLCEVSLPAGTTGETAHPRAIAYRLATYVQVKMRSRWGHGFP